MKAIGLGHGLGLGLGLGLLAGVLAPVVGGCTAPTASPVRARVAVASIAEARAIVPDCARAGVALEASVTRADLDERAALTALLDETAASSVALALRPLADEMVGGPSISSAALPALASDVERLAALMSAAPGARPTLVFDLAPPRALAAEALLRLDASVGSARGGRLYELLAMRLDEQGHLADAAMLGAIVAGARAGGIAVEARLWPILVDDGRDGDSALADALDVPIVARSSATAALPTLADGVDVVRLVADRSLWAGAAPPPVEDPAALAAAFAALARSLPATNARVGLALGGAIPNDASADVAAARAAAVDDFVLDGISVNDTAASLSALAAPADARSPTPALLDELRAAVRDADRLLGWH